MTRPNLFSVRKAKRALGRCMRRGPKLISTLDSGFSARRLATKGEKKSNGEFGFAVGLPRDATNYAAVLSYSSTSGTALSPSLPATTTGSRAGITMS
jgi:hypothetical protein